MDYFNNKIIVKKLDYLKLILTRLFKAIVFIFLVFLIIVLYMYASDYFLNKKLTNYCKKINLEMVWKTYDYIEKDIKTINISNRYFHSPYNQIFIVVENYIYPDQYCIIEFNNWKVISANRSKISH